MRDGIIQAASDLIGRYAATAFCIAMMPIAGIYAALLYFYVTGLWL